MIGWACREGISNAYQTINKQNAKLEAGDYNTTTSNELWDESDMSALGLSKYGLRIKFGSDCWKSQEQAYI